MNQSADIEKFASTLYSRINAYFSDNQISVKANAEMKGKIIDTIERGYFLNDKIIRYAKVVVGK